MLGDFMKWKVFRIVVLYEGVHWSPPHHGLFAKVTGGFPSRWAGDAELLRNLFQTLQTVG